MNKEKIEETPGDYHKTSLEDALRTFAFFRKVSLNDGPFLERCRNNNNDAVGFYDYVNKCFWFYDLDLNRWVREETKNYLTLKKMIREYGMEIK